MHRWDRSNSLPRARGEHGGATREADRGAAPSRPRTTPGSSWHQSRWTRRGVWVDPAAGRITVEAWVQEWCGTTVHLRASTKDRYERDLRRRVVPRFGQQRLVDVTPRQVTAWLAELTAQGATPSAVNRCFRVLRMVMNAAVRWGAAGQFTDARGPAPAGCTEGDAVPVRPGGALVGGGDPPVVRHMGVLRRLHGAAVERDAPSAPPRHRRGHRTGAGGTPTHQQRRTAGVRAVASNSRCAPSQGRTGWCS